MAGKCTYCTSGVRVLGAAVRFTRLAGTWSASVVSAHAFAIGVCAAAALSSFPHAASAQEAPDVAVVEVDPSSYFARSAEARAAVAREFYACHRDAYDFLVLLPAFPVDLSGESGSEVLGWHLPVRNEVAGIGQPAMDNGSFFGSAGRLRGIINLHSLVPGIQFASAEDALLTLAHEVGHQWSARVSFIDPATRVRSGALLGPGGAHWAYTLSSDASVMYGSRWSERSDGTFVASESRRRYSPLDLYLMGVLGADEVPPFTLIEPAPTAVVPANGLPPADGTSLAGVAKTISIGDVIAAEGPRVPAVADSPKVFRAAFVILVPAGQRPSAQQKTFVDGVRREWVNRFFFMTRGRALMETELVEAAPGTPTASPSSTAGIGYLVAEQRPDGTWADDEPTLVRETASALQALKYYRADARTGPAVEAGQPALIALQPSDNDSMARKLRALQQLGAPAPVELRAAPNPDGGVGSAPGYRSTVIDTALLALAEADAGSLDPYGERVAFLLNSQQGDGGWPYLAGGSSRVEAAAWVLQVLASLPASTPRDVAIQAGLTFLRSSQGPDGAFREDLFDSTLATAEAVMALDALGSLTESDAASATHALLASQSSDGSWSQSVYQTGVALRALRILLTPNLLLEDAALSRGAIYAGDPLGLQVRVRNDGRADASAFVVRAFRGDGIACDGGGAFLAALGAGEATTVQLTLDTLALSGSDLVFVVVDPADEVDERREDDNRRALPVQVLEPPVEPDLYVLREGTTWSPSSLDALPATVHLTIQVGNGGLASVAAATVAIAVRGQRVATLPVAVAGRSWTPVTLDVPVGAGPGPVEIGIVLDPQGVIAEADESNNEFKLVLSVTPSVDLAVGSLNVLPASVEQGGDVDISYVVRNSGSLDAAGVVTSVRITDSADRLVALLEDDGLAVAAGGSVERSIRWKAGVAGQLRVTADAAHPAERNPADNRAQADLTVLSSTKPNLALGLDAIAVEPVPALEGGDVTAKIRIRNTGEVPAGAFQVAIYLGEASPAGLLRTEEVGGLPAGWSIELLENVSVVAPGDLVLIARADPDGRITEFDETDNDAARAVSVLPLPDLALNAGAISLSNAFPRPEENVGVGVTVVNQGGQPAGGSTVTLYDGRPASGGTSLGSVSLSPLEAGGSRRVDFTWTPAADGPHTLVAIVTAPGTAQSDTTNDVAERLVPVQNADFALTNPFFSPNDDGVKDETTLAFRMAAPEPCIVEITDSAGEVVKRMDASPTSTAGAVSWDGRNERGQLAVDGTYTLTLKTTAETPRVIGSAAAVLDLNRSEVLRAAGTPMVYWEAFGGRVPNYAYPASVTVPKPDESGIIGYGCDNAGWCGIYSIGPGDAGASHLSGPGVITSETGYISSLSMSPDGQRIAFVEVKYGDGWGTLKVLSLTDQVVTVPSTGASALNWGRTTWTPDGRYLLFVSRQGVTRLDTAGGAIRELDGSRMAWEYALSPDGRKVALLVNPGDILVADIEGGDAYQVVWGLSAYPNGYWPGHRLAWLGDSRRLAFVERERGVSVVDVESLAVESVYRAAAGEEYWFRDYEELGASREGNLVAFGFASPRWPPITHFLVADLAGGSVEKLTDAPGFEYLYGFELSPLGTIGTAVGYRGSGGYWETPAIIGTLANLTAKVAATRLPGEATLSFQGTAADQNFARLELTVRGVSVDLPSRVVAVSDVPVVDGLLAQWRPTTEGVYEAALRVEDKAGNVRVARTSFAWSRELDVGAANATPEYISPNGDGVQDALMVSYTLRRPATFGMTFETDGGAIVRHVSVTELSPGDHVYEWDAKDDAGDLVPDGVYWLRLADRRIRFTVDTVRPNLTLEFGQPNTAGDRQTFVMGEAVTSPVSTSTTLLPGDYAVDAMVIVATTAEDPHLHGWEVRAGAEAVRSGTSNARLELTKLPIERDGGEPYSLEAWDLAGNRATLPITPPEAFFAVGYVPADAAIESGGLPLLQVGSSTVYRRLPSLGAMPEALGLPFETRMADGSPFCSEGGPAKARFFFAESIGEEITSVRVATRNSESDPWVEEGGEVLPGVAVGDAIAWRPSGVGPEGTFFRFIAETASGRRFESQAVKVTCPPPRPAPTLCADGDLARIGFSVAPSAATIEVRSLESPAAAPMRFSLADAVSDDGKSLTMNTGSWPGCRFAVDLSYRHADSLIDAHESWEFGRCWAEASFGYPTTLGFPRGKVTENYPGPVSDVLVYESTSSGDRGRLLGRTGPFDGAASLIPTDPDNELLRRGTYEFELEVLLPDGGRVKERDRTDRRPCHSPSDYSIIEANYAVVMWAGASGGCRPHATTRKIGLGAQARGTVKSANVYLEDERGGVAREIWRTDGPPASMFRWNEYVMFFEEFEFSLEGLSEGTYRVRGTLVDDVGTVRDILSIRESMEVISPSDIWVGLAGLNVDTGPVPERPELNRLVIDWSPPVATIASPSPGAQYCALRDGAITVRGSILGNDVVEARVHLRDVPGFPGVAFVDGAATVPIAKLAPGDYALRLEATDLAENMGCTPEVPVTLVGAPSFDSFTVEPLLISPDGDGVSDAASVGVSTENVERVTLSAARLGALVQWQPIGEWTLEGAREWQGTTADGRQLPDGRYLLRAVAEGTCGPVVERTTEVVVDTQPPAVSIGYPTPGAAVSYASAVLGTVSDPNLDGYRVTLWSGGAQLAALGSGQGGVSGPLAPLSLAGLPPGEYTVRVDAWDVAGHSATSSVTFDWAPGAIIDTLSVAPAFVSPNGDGVQDEATVSVGLRAPAALTVDLLHADGTVAATLAARESAGAGVESLALSGQVAAILADGQYVVRVKAEAGGSAESASDSLVIDRVAPSVSVESPSVATVVPGAATFTGSITDGNLSAWSVTLRSSAGEALLDQGSVSTSNLALPLLGLDEGAFTLIAHARDLAGNVRKVEVPFVSDLTPPVPEIWWPSPGQIVSSREGLVFVTGAITEANPGTWRLDITDPAAADGHRLLAEGTGESPSGVLSAWDLSSQPDGPAVIRLTAVDRAGHESSATVDIVIDGTPPMVAITSPRDRFVTTDEHVMGTASDDRLVSYMLELSDGYPGTAFRFVEIASGAESVIDGELARMVGQLPDGTYTLRLTGSDAAGNVASVEAAFEVDRTPPAPPIQVAAQLERDRDAIVTWTPSVDGDVVAYRLVRAADGGGFQPIGPTAILGLSYLDPGLNDGTWHYEVIAVDRAGLESVPSPEAVLEVDRSPPLASISRPTKDARVHGVIDVVGSAMSLSDFKEYRLDVGRGGSPSAFDLLRTARAPIVANLLGVLDTTGLAEESVWTLRLQAEDTSGNVAESRVSVTVDNVPPLAPVLSSAVLQPASVLLTWQPVDASDLAGYLVYRNGTPVNGDTASVFSNPVAFVLPKGTTSFSDENVPDGTLRYRVQAVDLAANLSALSNELSVNVDRRAPQATIVSPSHLGAVKGLVDVVAYSVDEDVASMQIEARNAADGGNFLPLGVAITSPPWVARLDPSGFKSVIEVRARARDAGGRTDPAPASVFLFNAPALGTPNARAVVNERLVSFEVLAAPGGAMPAFRVERPYGSYSQVLSWDANATFGASTASSNAASAAQAMDGSSYTCWTPVTGPNQWWQGTLSQERVLESVRAVVVGTYDLLVRVDGAWVPVARGLTGDGTRRFLPTLGADAVRLSFVSTSGNRICEVSPVPVTRSSPPVSETLSQDGTYEYVVTALGRFGELASTRTTARIYAPQLDALASRVGDPAVVVNGGNATPLSTVTVRVNGADAGMASAGADGRFAVPVLLQPGSNAITAQAVDPVGNRSRVSDARSVQYEVPPQATLSLFVDGVSGSDVSLTYSVAGDPSGIGSFEILRRSGAADVVVGRTSADVRSFQDHLVPNGTYEYRVRAVSLSGLAGTPSDCVEVDVFVAPPEAAFLSLTVPATGGALDLAWTFPGTAKFRIERATGPGLFEVVAPTASGAGYRDTGLVNGAEYRYRVEAVDAAGNGGPPSNVVTGIPRDSVAPSAPVFDTPTVAGSAVTVTDPVSAIGGRAEYGSRVEVYEGGQYVGEDVADDLGGRETPVALLSGVSGTPTLASSGEPIAHFVGSPPGNEIAFGWPSSETWRRVSLPFGAVGSPSLSPDGGTAAMVLEEPGRGYAIYLVDAALGEVHRTAVEGGWIGDAMAWSPSGDRIVYRIRRQDLGIGVLDVATGSELAFRPEARGVVDPQWLGEREVGYLTYSNEIVGLNLDSGAERLVASRPWIDVWAANPATGRIAIMGGDEADIEHIWIVDGGGAAGTIDGGARSMKFSPDGRSLGWLRWDGSLAVVVEPWTRTFEVGRASSGGKKLGWADSAISVAGYGVLWRWDIEGRFTVPTRLHDGVQTFTAAAVDGAGLRSGWALPIQVTLDGSALADLSVGARVQPALPVVGDKAMAMIDVRNAGAAAAGGSARIVLERPDGVAETSSGVPVPLLAAGEAATVMVGFDASLPGEWRVTVMVDPSPGVGDSDYSNNQIARSFSVAAMAGVGVTLAIDPGEVEPGGVATASVLFMNSGPAVEGAFVLALADTSMANGSEVARRILSLPGASVTTEQVAIPADHLLAGSYRLWATFVPASGGAEPSASAPLTILPDTSASLRLVASRAEYFPADPIELSAFVSNASRNAALYGGQLAVWVADSTGAVVWTTPPQPLPMIWLGGEVAASAMVPAGQLEAGEYQATAAVSVNGAEVASSSTTFSVAAEPLLVGQLDLVASGAPPTVKRGMALPVTATARNVGTGTALDVIARLHVVDSTGAALADYEVSLGDLAPQGSGVLSAMLPTDGLVHGLYGLALSATHDGKTESIATARFRVTDGLAPTLAFLNLTDGMFVRDTVTARVQANDDATGVESVTGITPTRAPLSLESGSPISGVWTASLPLPVEGANVITVAARDAEGNDGLLSQSALNPIAVTVIRDTVPPELSITGVSEGALVNHAVVPVIAAVDLHLGGVEAWLDGTTFAQGSSVTSDGEHLVRATATDRAGNSTNASLGFTIDRTAPNIRILGVGNGAYSTIDVSPRVVVEDPHLDGYTVTLDGAPFAEGTLLSEERTYQLAVEARDLAGNVATDQLAFTIDKSPPAITILGVSEGEWFAGAAAPDVVFSDVNLASAEVTLDGTTWPPGSQVAGEGEHVLVARAVDEAGNRSERSVRFFVDVTPPVISIAGVSEGDLLNYPVTPLVTVTEANLATSETRIDGVVALPGEAVSAEGRHVVEATASDLAGNVATARVIFEIDTTAPVIQVSVEDGAAYSAPLSIAFSADDPHLGDVGATLDGLPLSSGSAVDTGGPHVLVVSASDLAGNVAERRVQFTIGGGLRADLTMERIGRSSDVLAWVSDGCRTTGAKSEGMRAFIALSVPGAAIVEFPPTSQEFQRRLRSGEFGVFVVAAVDRQGARGEGGASSGDAACDRLDSVTERELREAVFRGGGLIVIKRTPNELPDLREALGVHFQGEEHAEWVHLVQSAFTEPGLLAIDGGIELELEGGSPVGGFGEEESGGDDVAVSAHRFGAGEAVVFGFDLSSALPLEVASATLGSAVGFAAGEADQLPAGVVGVQVRVQNRGGATTFKVVEELDPALEVARVLDSGSATGAGAIEWSGQLDVDELETLRYFVKLPSLAGSWQTRSSLYLGAGTSPVADASLALLVGGDRATLESSAEGAVQRLPTAKADGERRRRLLAMLADVAANPGDTPVDRERAIVTLLDAASLASKVESLDPTEARVAIDRLLAWWEMKP